MNNLYLRMAENIWFIGPTQNLLMLLALTVERQSLFIQQFDNLI